MSSMKTSLHGVVICREEIKRYLNPETSAADRAELEIQISDDDVHEMWAEIHIGVLVFENNPMFEDCRKGQEAKLVLVEALQEKRGLPQRPRLMGFAGNWYQEAASLSESKD